MGSRRGSLLFRGLPVLLLLALPSVAAADHGPADLVTAGPAGAVGHALSGITPDGEHAYFYTTVPVVAADTDDRFDVYERFAGNTTLISTGTPGQSGTHTPAWYGASMDGARAFFVTDEELTSDDTDCQATGECYVDVFERASGRTLLVSTGDRSGSDEFNAFPPAFSPDGARAFFYTSEQLVPGDICCNVDVYERSVGTTKLIRSGLDGMNSSEFLGGPADDGRVFFSAGPSVVPGGIYERRLDGTITMRVSNSSGDVVLVDYSSDGERIFFETYSRLTAADTDSQKDIYENAGGVTRLVSTGPAGGSGAQDVSFWGASEDGSGVFFATREALVAGDTDQCESGAGCMDVYEHAGGTTTLLTTGPAGGNGAFHVCGPGAFGSCPPLGLKYFDTSADGLRVFFHTREQLVAGDTDSSVDVYERSDSGTTLVSTGSTGGSGSYDAQLPFFAEGPAVSRDGDRLFFETSESLVLGDLDTTRDVYERSNGETRLLSTGPAGGSGPFESQFNQISSDGTRVFFATQESLVSSDTNGNNDVYVVKASPTADLSVTQSGAPNPVLAGRPFTFTATIRNETSESANRVTLIDTLPSSVYFDSATPSQGHCHQAGATVGCNLGSLDGGESATVEIRLRSKRSAGQHMNKAVVRAAETDRDYSDNSSLASIAVTSPTPGYARPRAATPMRLALVPAYRDCSDANARHGDPLSVPSCSPPQLSSNVLTTNGLMGAHAFLKALPGKDQTPEDEADIQVTGSINDVRCIGAVLPSCTGAGAQYDGRLLLTAGIRMTDRKNGPFEVDSATAQDAEIGIPVDCASGLCSISTTGDAMYPGLVEEEKRTVIELKSLTVRDAGLNGTGYGSGCPPSCGDGDEADYLQVGLFAP